MRPSRAGARNRSRRCASGRAPVERSRRPDSASAIAAAALDSWRSLAACSGGLAARRVPSAWPALPAARRRRPWPFSCAFCSARSMMLMLEALSRRRCASAARTGSVSMMFRHEDDDQQQPAAPPTRATGAGTRARTPPACAAVIAPSTGMPVIFCSESRVEKVGCNCASRTARPRPAASAASSTRPFERGALRTARLDRHRRRFDDAELDVLGALVGLLRDLRRLEALQQRVVLLLVDFVVAVQPRQVRPRPREWRSTLERRSATAACCAAIWPRNSARSASAWLSDSRRFW